VGQAAGLELFTNDALGVVTSGGTDAPASGTVQTWLVTQLNPFAGASSSATPPTFFYIADYDVAYETEKILVTNISGSTWTVTRGADGTTPVAHLANWTAVQVVTRATLQVLQRPWLVRPSGDATGVADAAAINGAIAGNGSAELVPGATYYIAAGHVTMKTGQWITARGAYINAVGTGDVFRLVDTSTYTTRNPNGGGGILGFPVIDGTSAGAGSNGVHAGDIFRLRIEVTCQNFTGAGDYGVLFDNENYWTEQLYARTYTLNCTNHVGYTKGGSGTGSFARADAIHYIGLGNVAHNGVVLAAGMNLYDLVQLGIYGNCTSGASGSAGAVLTMGASSAIAGRLNIGVECSAGAVLPQSINFGSGALVTASGFTDFHGEFAASNNAGAWQYDGLVYGESTLPRRTFYGSESKAVATGGTFFPSVSSVVVCTATAAATGLIIANNQNQGQVFTIVNTSAYLFTFAAAATSNVSGGTGVTIPAGTAQQFWFDTTTALWFPL